MFHNTRKFLIRFCYYQVEREKLKTEEVANKTVQQRSELDKVIAHLEEDNVEMNKQLQITQSQLSEAEQLHAQR